MFNPNQAFLVMQKLKSALKGFTVRVKAELKKTLCKEDSWLKTDIQMVTKKT